MSDEMPKTVKPNADRTARLQTIADHKAWEGGANPALDKTRDAEEKILKREQGQKPEPEMIRPSFDDKVGYADTASQRPQWERQDKEAAARKADNQRVSKR